MRQSRSRALRFRRSAQLDTTMCRTNAILCVRNISLNENSIVLPSANGSFEAAAISLNYEGTRVKSALIGRDLNPMGRGDGIYYFAGAVKTIAVLSSTGTNQRPGTGNSANNCGQCGSGGCRPVNKSPYQKTGFGPDDNVPHIPDYHFYIPDYYNQGGQTGTTPPSPAAAVVTTPVVYDPCAKTFQDCYLKANAAWDVAYGNFESKWNRIKAVERDLDLHWDWYYPWIMLILGIAIDAYIIYLYSRLDLWQQKRIPNVTPTKPGDISEWYGKDSGNLVKKAFGVGSIGTTLVASTYLLKCLARIRLVEIPMWEAYQEFDAAFIDLHKAYEACLEQGGCSDGSSTNRNPKNRFDETNKPNDFDCLGRGSIAARMHRYGQISTAQVDPEDQEGLGKWIRDGLVE